MWITPNMGTLGLYSFNAEAYLNHIQMGAAGCLDDLLYIRVSIKKGAAGYLGCELSIFPTGCVGWRSTFYPS